MPKFITRVIAKSIKEQQAKFPILGITGPRQSGKTTLLRHLFKDYTYISLENPDLRSFALEDPNGFGLIKHILMAFNEVPRFLNCFLTFKLLMNTEYFAIAFIRITKFSFTE